MGICHELGMFLSHCTHDSFRCHLGIKSVVLHAVFTENLITAKNVLQNFVTTKCDFGSTL